jgi:hypothetical protein
VEAVAEAEEVAVAVEATWVAAEAAAEAAVVSAVAEEVAEEVAVVVASPAVPRGRSVREALPNLRETKLLLIKNNNHYI